MTARTPFVSDHALLRYLERAYEIDIEAVRAEIVDLAKPGIERGLSYYDTGEWIITIKNRTVTTIYRRDASQPRARAPVEVPA